MIREEKKQQEQANLQKHGMKQSYPSMFFKIIVGCFFIWLSFLAAKVEESVKIVEFLIGIFFIARGVVPFLFRKREKRS